MSVKPTGAVAPVDYVERQVYTLAEAAAALAINPRTFYRQNLDVKLKAFTLTEYTRQRFIAKAEVERYIAERAAAAEEFYQQQRYTQNDEAAEQISA